MHGFPCEDWKNQNQKKGGRLSNQGGGGVESDPALISEYLIPWERKILLLGQSTLEWKQKN